MSLPHYQSNYQRNRQDDLPDNHEYNFEPASAPTL